MQHLGSLTVTLEPQGAVDAGAQWSIDSLNWQDSGATLEHLPVGTYGLVFKEVEGWDLPTHQQPVIAKNETTSTTGTYAQELGALTVEIAPQAAVDAGAQWSIDAGTTWQDSGATVEELPVGDYTVTFKAVDGWDTPADQTATVEQDTTTTKTTTYVEQLGAVSITLAPQEAIDAGAQWSIDAGTTWQDSGATVEELSVGDYTVTLKTVAGWNAPSAFSITVEKDATATATATYDLQEVGSLSVSLTPQAAVDDGAQWSVDAGTTWHDSGAMVTGLLAGDHTVTFNAVVGWTSPADLTVTISADAPTTETAAYTAKLGSLSITLFPDAAVAAGARWSIDGGTTWLESGATLEDILAVDYTVSFSAVDGWRAPTPYLVTVVEDALESKLGIYAKNAPTGELWGMGQTSQGALGDQVDPEVNLIYPAKLGDWDVASVATGVYNSLFVTSDGALYGMGDSEYGQLGTGTSGEEAKNLPPTEIVSSGITQVAAGDYQSYFIDANGVLYGMGWNGSGELGDGTFETPRTTPIVIRSGVVAIEADNGHAVFLDSSGVLWGIGKNSESCFGLGAGYENAYFNEPVMIRSNVVAMATNLKSSMFIDRDGALWGMGGNDSHELGGTPTDRHVPEVIRATGVVSVAMGKNNSYFIDSDGALWGMGGGSSGQLGQGDRSGRSYPTMIRDSGIKSVTVSTNNVQVAVIFIDDAGRAWAMGNNFHGRLGIGNYDDQVSPVEISSLPRPVSSVSIGERHTVVIMEAPVYGALGVTIEPQAAVDAGAQWSVDGGTTWNDSGATVEGLETGDYTVTFKAVADWYAPADIIATIAEDTTTRETATYAAHVGSVTVTITPAAVNEDGARWSVDNGSSWHASGATVADMPVGTYQLRFSTVTKWHKPDDQTLTITENAELTPSGAYIPYMGSLTVSLTPPEAIPAGGQWSIDGGTTWNNSGETISDLLVGEYPLTYKDVEGWLKPADRTAEILDEFNTTITGVYVLNSGELTVNLTPQAAIDLGAQWSIDGGTTWHASGVTVDRLPAAEYTITYKAIDGWNTPTPVTLYIGVGGDPTQTGVYTQHAGTLSVTLMPSGAVTAGAQWSINAGTTWRASGATVSDLVVGDYTVTFKAVDGWDTPADQTATIAKDATSTASATYVQQLGSISITLAPQAAVDLGAQWSIDGGTTWHDSAATVADLPVGDYTVTLKTVAGWNAPSAFTVTVLKNATTNDSATYAEHVGALTVTLSPAAAVDLGAQWSIDGGTTWHNSAATVTDLPIGDYTVTFRAVAGWDSPADATATVTKDATTTASATYVQQVGSISVTLSPAAAVDLGAQWSLDGGLTWHDSEATVADLPVGEHNVTFKIIDGWNSPASQTATVTKDATTTVSATYTQQLGSISITLVPQTVVDLSAQWSIDGGTTWHDSADTVADLPVGDYTVTLKTVAGWNAPSAFTVTVLGNASSNDSATYLQQLGALQVQLNPAAVRSLGAQWSIDGGSTWHDHNATVSDLPVGDYTVIFKSVTGWTSPAAQTVTITDATTTSATGLYVALPTGSATVTILPAIVRDAGAQWSIDGGSTWRDSGASLSGLYVGTYTVTFNAVAGWLAPPAASITITDSATASATGVHLPIKGDFDDDGLSDLILQSGSGAVRIIPSSETGDGFTADPAHPSDRARSAGPAPFAADTDLTLPTLSNWTIRDIADFNGDTLNDLVVQDASGAVCILEQNSNGAIALWYIQDEVLQSSAFLFANPLPGWYVRSAGDLDGDGDADLVLQNSDGARVFWYLQNGTLAASAFLTANFDPAWEVRAVVSASGSTTVLAEQNTATRAVRTQTITGTTSTATAILDTIPGYGVRLVAAGPLTTSGEPVLLMADASNELHKWVIAAAAPIAPIAVTDSGTVNLLEVDGRTFIGMADWDANGSADILWRDATGRIGVTWMDSGSPTSSAWVSTTTSSHSGVGVGDFDLDGIPDLVLRSTTGDLLVQYLHYTGSTLSFGSRATILTGLADWRIAAVGQLGDPGSSADLILQHSSGLVAYWEMANTSISASGFIFAGSLPGWTVGALIDIGQPAGTTPDGRLDLLLYQANGTVAAWYLTRTGSGPITIGGSAVIGYNTGGAPIVGAGAITGGTQADLLLQTSSGGSLTVQPFTNQTPGSPSTLALPVLSADNRTIIGTADIDGDTNLDLFWTIGSLRIGVTRLDANGDAISTFWLNTTAYTGWTATGVTDFDSDGHPDVIIRDSSGTVALWRYEGATRSGGYFLTGALADWDPVGTGDLDADGGTDLLLQNRTTGDLVVWYYQNLTFTGAGSYLLTDLGSLRVKAVGDFDGDRIFDLILQHPTTGAVTLRPLNGTGTPLTLPTGYTPRNY